jgi:PHD/YefM family antitoxin component YafN of YafNO toxin-antitoxin module
MTNIFSVAEMRKPISMIINRATLCNEHFVLTKYGKQVAVLLSIHEYKKLIEK